MKTRYLRMSFLPMICVFIVWVTIAGAVLSLTVKWWFITPSMGVRSMNVLGLI
jgi:hypothetical protein